MRPDRMHIVVRPRGILECLDLAAAFCGRRPLAVLATIMAGAAPMIACNRSLAAIGPDESLLVPICLLLALQTAWAPIPLTLFLGQAVFTRRFSWRHALRSFAAALPALLLFQGLLRALCLAICLLAPVVFVGMYYLGPILLLEQPTLGNVWSRRAAMNRGQTGRILGLMALDTCLLAVGTWLGTAFLDAFGAAWQGRPVHWLPDPARGILPLVLSWHGQLAFWVTGGFLTVFRFFTYLDARIRREGWDVELRLRADETWVGVERSTARGFVGTATVILALCAFLAPIEAAADGDGDLARRALASQGFPWYDSENDAYRPLVPDDVPPEQSASRPPQPPTATSPPTDENRDGSRTKPNAGEGGAGPPASWPSAPSIPPPSIPGLDRLGGALLIGLLIVAVLALVILVLRHGGRARLPKKATGDEPGGDDERFTALPEAARLPADELLARAAMHAEREEFSRAMLFFHAWQLRELDTRGVLRLACGKTNGQYALEVASTAPAAAGLFRRSSRLFEDAFFGGLQVPRGDFLTVWEARGTLPDLPAAKVSP